MWGCHDFASPGGVKLLMIESDHNDRALLAWAAEHADVQIFLTSVQICDEAIDYLEGRGRYAERLLHPIPDLLVLDLKLPGMSGQDFLQWRQSSTLAAQVPVALFTAVVDPAEIQMAVRTGGAEFVHKPDPLTDWLQAARRIWEFGMARRQH